jgi:primosomal protein N' (replication factor Y)
LQKNSLEFKNYINEKLNSDVLGPVNAPIYKIRKKFRVRLLIRGKKSLKIQNSLSLAIKNFKFEKGIKLSVDVDPINFN